MGDLLHSEILLLSHLGDQPDGFSLPEAGLEPGQKVAVILEHAGYPLKDSVALRVLGLNTAE